MSDIEIASKVKGKNILDIANSLSIPCDALEFYGNYKAKIDFKKIKNKNVVVLYFARCFTLDAVKIISEKKGEIFSLIEFPWTDAKYNKIHGG